jgi:hypothetical protein
MEHAQRVAKAFADRAKDLGTVAAEELGQIEETINSLRAEADLIRGMAGLTAKPVTSPIPLRPRRGLSGGKLTTEEKKAIYAIIQELLEQRSEGEVTADAVVTEAEHRGIHLRARWALPASAVGTMLHFAKQKHAAAS